MAAPAITGAPVSVAYGSATSISRNAPTRNSGDLLLMGLWIESTTASPSTPSGWSLLASFERSGKFKERVYGRIADGSATDNFASSWTGSVGRAGEMWRVTGNDTTIGNVKVGAAANGSSSKATLPALETASAENLILGFHNALGEFTVSKVTEGWTEEGEWCPIVRKALAAKGTSGALEITYSSSQEWGGIQIAVPPKEETKSVTVEAPAAVAKAAAPAPGIAAAQNLTVAPPAAVAKAVAAAPAISTGSDVTVSPPAAVAKAKAPAPTAQATQSVTVKPPAAEAKAVAPAPSVISETPAPPTRVAVSREYPPDQLAWRIDPPKGAPARWAADEPLNENVATGIQLNEQKPGGETTALCTLSRNPRQPWPDLAAFSRVSVYGPGVEEVWGGRLDKAPENDGDRMVIGPECVGNQAYLEDDAAIIGPGFIDQELSKWTGASAQRKIDNGSTYDQSPEPSVSPDAGGVPWISMTSTGKITRPVWVAMYDAGPGIRIGQIAGVVAPLNVQASTFDPNVATGIYAMDDDRFTNGEVLHDVSAGGGFSFSVNSKQCVAFQGTYNAEEAGADGTEYGYRLTKLVVLGDTGLALLGTWPDIGFTAKQMLTYAIPLHTELEANEEDVEDTGYIIQQAWYSDPSTMKAKVEDICKYDLFDWWVDGQKRFHLKRPGSYGREWLAYAGPSGLSDAGLDSSRLWKSIVVSWQDVDGTTKTVGPPGSGATFTNSNLEITDPDHPAVKAGITRQDLLSLNTVATESAAVRVGERFLEEANQLSTSGSATLSNYAMESKGIFRPVSQLRAGDRVRVVDAADPSPRPVTGRSYDHPSRTVSVDLGAPPGGLAALLERMQAEISSLQLS